jgi:hypothetical protein
MAFCHGSGLTITPRSAATGIVSSARGRGTIRVLVQCRFLRCHRLAESRERTFQQTVGIARGRIYQIKNILI